MSETIEDIDVAVAENATTTPTRDKSSQVGNAAAMRTALEKFSAVDLSRLKFPLDGDSSAIYNSDKKEITIPYWRVAELLNEVKVAQDMAKAALSEPVRNCDIGTVDEQYARWDKHCQSMGERCSECSLHKNYFDLTAECYAKWAQMPYESEVKNG
jgi:hypothetical protein